jgi:rubrerythrin
MLAYNISPKDFSKFQFQKLEKAKTAEKEQQVFKDCNSSGTGEVFKNTEFINSTGGIINPSGTTFGLDINKPHPFFENEDLAQETAEQIKQAIKEKNDKPQLSWKFIEEMAKRMTNNKSNGIITKEVLEEFKNTNFAFKLYEVLAGKQINNTVIGKKENNDKPQLSILFTQFPKALEAITKCSEYGHLKYKETDTDYLNYQRVEGGSKAYADAGLRHRLYKKGTTDIESQLPHYYHVAWNALAELELLIKENSK